ncbi:S1 RNA-binding domain-containing protein, partial [Chlamydiia bacterium]|nr:S1 RNA-binding domain-containing protein [Chlamydiia bacterium]
PWETIEKTIPVGSVVSGNVVKISAFGATVKLESGMQGLIHVTELTDKPFGKVEEVIRMGEEVKAKVISLDTNNKRIQLSLKELTVEQQNVDHDDIVVNKSNND